MLVTQSAPFKGYKDMDASEIPQFEPGEKDAIALMFLEEAGTSNHYDYCSIFKRSSTR